MVNQRIIDLAKPFYGNFPGPGSDTYDKAEEVSGVLRDLGIRDSGVIGVGKSDGERTVFRREGATTQIWDQSIYYLGFSPGLQRKVISELGRNPRNRSEKTVAHFRLGRTLEERCMTTFILCWKVADRIIASVKDNRGCAEKKIVSSFDTYPDESLKEISVVAHPDSAYADDVPAHVVAVGAEGAVIAPCESCRAIYHG